MLNIIYLGVGKPTNLGDWIFITVFWLLIIVLMISTVIGIINGFRKEDNSVESNEDKLEKLLLDNVNKNKGIIDLLMTTNNPEVLNLVSRLKDQHKLDEVIYDILDDIDDFDYDYAATMTNLNTIKHDEYY